MNKKIISILSGLFLTFNMSNIFANELNDNYMKEVIKKIPDMQDIGKSSNERSKKEGAALQFITTSGIYKSGFSKEDFSYLMNNEAKVVKEYVKGTKLKGYLFIDHTLYFSKGYPDLPKNELEEFKKNAECQNGYCVYININSIKVVNEQLKEISFDKSKFMNIVDKYTENSKLWEIKENEIPEPYKAIAIKVISGYGLGGLDALDLAKNKDKK